MPDRHRAALRAVSAHGARFLHGPTDHPWAYEMQVVDLDGHVLRFGSEPKQRHVSPGIPPRAQ